MYPHFSFCKRETAVPVKEKTLLRHYGKAAGRGKAFGRAGLERGGGRYPLLLFPLTLNGCEIKMAFRSRLLPSKRKIAAALREGCGQREGCSFCECGRGCKTIRGASLSAYAERVRSGRVSPRKKIPVSPTEKLYCPQLLCYNKMLKYHLPQSGIFTEYQCYGTRKGIASGGGH